MSHASTVLARLTDRGITVRLDGNVLVPRGPRSANCYSGAPPGPNPAMQAAFCSVATTTSPSASPISPTPTLSGSRSC